MMQTLSAKPSVVEAEMIIGDRRIAFSFIVAFLLQVLQAGPFVFCKNLPLLCEEREETVWALELEDNVWEWTDTTEKCCYVSITL